MTRILISYEQSDAGEIAGRLADRLRKSGHEVFADSESIKTGALWSAELNRQMRRTNLTMVLVSPASAASDCVYKTVREAEKYHKPVVPVLIDATPLPVFLRGTWQAISLEEENVDGVLLQVERAIRDQPRLKISGVTLALVLAAALVGIAAVITVALLLNHDDSSPAVVSAPENDTDFVTPVVVVPLIGEDFGLPAVVTVDSGEGWQSTDVRIEEGATLDILVINGEWTDWQGRTVYNSGLSMGYACTGDKCVEPLSGVTKGSLIGRIGDEIFLVGQHIRFEARQSGVLSLRMNDTDDGLYDNDGALTVEIRLSKE